MVKVTIVAGNHAVSFRGATILASQALQHKDIREG